MLKFLRSQKGTTIAELITAMFLISLVSLFSFRLYLYIHKRYLEWQRDKGAALVMMAATHSLNTTINHLSFVKGMGQDTLSGNNTQGKGIRIYPRNGKLYINDRNILPDESALDSLRLVRPVQSDMAEFPLPVIQYRLDFHFRNKYYNLTGSAMLDRLKTSDITGEL
ncbi:MAG: hypothetical protein A2293_13345 [Elusimicrobia bacterium RIFOXYB2_FULL_49_7]|nr:MAG: hypothetical protein A2293_13345 [Elusimicrobia bacterium RIFOXYB2_FULL_49_7]